MTIKEQNQEFLQWLKNKHTELLDGYWEQTEAGRQIYRKLLILTHAEMVATAELLTQ